MARGLGAAVICVLPLVLSSCPNPLQFLIERDTAPRHPTIVVRQGETVIDCGEGYDCGSTLKGDARDISFVIYNEGTGDLVLAGDPVIAVSGADADCFTIAAPPDSSIPESGNTDFTVRLESSDPGSKTAVLTIESNDEATPSYMIDLGGTVTDYPEPEINVRQGTNSLSDGSGVYNFGNVYPDGDGGIASSDITFTVENIGTADLTVTGVSLSGGDVDHFDLTDTTFATVPYTGANYTTFTVRFDPLDVGDGSKAATVLITNSDSDEGEYTFTVAGPSTEAPTLTTATPTDITGFTATGGGEVVHEGGSAVTERGVCWNTGGAPTTAGSHAVGGGTGMGVFTSSMTSLTPGTGYCVRAYATNGTDTGYGDEMWFSTLSYATLTTTAISAITGIAATSGGNITWDGGAAVTARGVCWSTTTGPIATGSHTTDGAGTGSFTSSITGLETGHTYYVRAYAVTSVDTAYGNERTFTTPTLPAVTTTAASSITSHSASSGGNVTSTGGAATTRGVCWSTSENPIATGDHTTNGTGAGTFTSSITGLTGGTQYHVRAYATNVVGTTYGDDLAFTTSAAVLASLTTTAISDVTGHTASSGGSISNDGGSAVTARGVCWSTTTGPIATGSHTTDGTGTGSFTSSITGLAANTTYYVRAYATNAVGTAYGNERSFPTDTLPTVTTTAISSIHATSAAGGGNVTADGGETVTVRGVCWDTNTNPTIDDSYTENGSGTGAFSSSLTSLTVGTMYYVRAYATNSVGTGYGNEVSFRAVYAAGDLYGGGMVVYVTGTYPNQHGYIAALTDQAPNETLCGWDDPYAPTTGATGTALGTGQTNTATIVGLRGSTAAAAWLCDQLDLNGYTDWYLPSKDEFEWMYAYRNSIGMTWYWCYWTSSETDSGHAYAYYASGGPWFEEVKHIGHCVRAMRSF